MAVPGGDPRGMFLRVLDGKRDQWETPGFRINAGESLLLFSRGAASCGYTGFYIEA